MRSNSIFLGSIRKPNSGGQEPQAAAEDGEPKDGAPGGLQDLGQENQEEGLREVEEEAKTARDVMI